MNVKKNLFKTGICFALIAPLSVSTIYARGAKNGFYREYVRRYRKSYDFFYSGNRKRYGWIKYRNRWYYVQSSRGKVVNQIKYINGRYYGFLRNGERVSSSGWYTINGKTYYILSTGIVLRNQWLKYKNKMYYLSGNGTKLTGVRNIGSSTYYFNSRGERETGWKYYNKRYHYFYSSGPLAKNNALKIGNSYYLFDASGNRYSQVGINYFSKNKQYYYVLNNGTLYNRGWISYKGKKYYFYSNAQAKRNTWFDEKINTSYSRKGKTYYFTNDGSVAIGARKVGKYYYYFTSQGERYSGWLNNSYYGYRGDLTINRKMTINGKDYFFDNNGKLITKTGFVNVGGSTYYLTSVTNYLKNTWKHIGNVDYYFDNNGRLVRQTGLFTSGDKTYYINPDNTYLRNSWKRIGNDYYYFDNNGVMVKSDTIITSDGHISIVDNYGRKITQSGSSFTKDGKKWYYIPAREGNYSDTFRPASHLKGIVIHYTGNKKDTALQNANYFARDRVDAGAHFFVDATGIYMSTPLERGSWSVGVLHNIRYASYWNSLNNFNTINIEIACDDGNYKSSQGAIDNAIYLTKYLKQKFNINTVVRHKDVAGKVCPAYWWDDAVWKKEFLNKVGNSSYTPIASSASSLPQKSVTEIAREVIDGKYGNGDVRKQKLESMGYNYQEVQNEVKRLLS